MQHCLVDFAVDVIGIGLAADDIGRRYAVHRVPFVPQDDVVISFVGKDQAIAGHAFARMFVEDRDEGGDACTGGKEYTWAMVSNRAGGVFGKDFVAGGHVGNLFGHPVVVRVGFDNELHNVCLRLGCHGEGAVFVPPAVFVQGPMGRLARFELETCRVVEGQVPRVVGDGGDGGQGQGVGHGEVSCRGCRVNPDLAARVPDQMTICWPSSITRLGGRW